MVHKNNLISEAYLFFTINLQHSGKFQTPRMIKAVLDSKHMTIPSKVVPFIYNNPISLFQGTSVKESSKLIRTAKLIWIHCRKYTDWKSLIFHCLSVFSVNLVSLIRYKHNLHQKKALPHQLKLNYKTKKWMIKNLFHSITWKPTFFQ